MHPCKHATDPIDSDLIATPTLPYIAAGHPVWQTSMQQNDSLFWIHRQITSLACAVHGAELGTSDRSFVLQTDVFLMPFVHTSLIDYRRRSGVKGNACGGTAALAGFVCRGFFSGWLSRATCIYLSICRLRSGCDSRT